MKFMGPEQYALKFATIESFHTHLMTRIQDHDIASYVPSHTLCNLRGKLHHKHYLSHGAP